MSYSQQLLQQQLKSLQHLHTNLQSSLKKQQQLLINIQQGKLQQATKTINQILQTIQQATPIVQKFQNKIMYRPQQQLIQKQGKIQITKFQVPTYVQTQLNSGLGVFEHAIVQQIQFIDSEKKDAATYKDINEGITKRMFYCNKTMDICIDYLFKKL